MATRITSAGQSPLLNRRNHFGGIRTWIYITRERQTVETEFLCLPGMTVRDEIVRLYREQGLQLIGEFRAVIVDFSGIEKNMDLDAESFGYVQDLSGGHVQIFNI